MIDLDGIFDWFIKENGWFVVSKIALAGTIVAGVIVVIRDWLRGKK